MSTITGQLRAYRLPRIEVEEPGERTERTVSKEPAPRARPSAELAAAGVLFVAILALMAAMGSVVFLALFR